MQKILWSLAFLVLSGASAAAQTAEEAIAYAFFGLADGGKLVRGTTTMSWTESSPSPAAFESDATVKGGAAKLRFTVTAKSPCEYEIVIEGPPNLVPGGRRLFGRVSLDKVAAVTLADDGFHAAVSGTGFCETGRTNPDCLAMDSADLFGMVDSARQQAAVAFLRNEVCVAPKT